MWIFQQYTTVIWGGDRNSKIKTSTFHWASKVTYSMSCMCVLQIGLLTFWLLIVQQLKFLVSLSGQPQACYIVQSGCYGNVCICGQTPGATTAAKTI